MVFKVFQKLFTTLYSITYYFRNAYWTETLLKIAFSVIGRCPLVPTSHWRQGKCARIYLSQAASGMILQNHRRLSVSIFSVKFIALGYLKGVTGRIFKISKLFQRSNLKLWVRFFHQLWKKKIVKKPSANIQKVPIYYYKP